MPSEYGWSVSQIMDEVALDEALDLIKKIQRGKIEQQYMHALIVQNPHTKNPKVLIDKLREAMETDTSYRTDPFARPERNAGLKLQRIFATIKNKR